MNVTEDLILSSQDARPKREDDIDDFMANLLSGELSTPAPKPRPSVNRAPAPLPRPSAQPIKPSPSVNTRGTQPKSRKRIKRGIKNSLIASVILITLVVSVFALRGPISAMLEPKSPFTTEQKENMGIPLYYPTKLPGTYKIELGSISQPENGVVMYALSDDNNQRINVTLQKKPEGLSLEPLYTVLKDTRDINTKHGVVKYGTSEDGISVANVLMPDTWVIINSTSGLLDDSGLKTIVDSLKY